MMVVIQAVLAFLTRSAGRLLNTASAWATVLLFGRVPQDRQIYLSILTFGSVIWLIAVLGVAFPAVATFLLSFVTLPPWVDKSGIRLVMLIASVILPAVVGLVSVRLVDESARPKTARATAVTVLKGYPYTLGLALTLIMMTVFAPVVKVRDILRTSLHVPVIIEADAYREVVDDVQRALKAGGIESSRQRASWLLRVPTKILMLFARDPVARFVADDLARLVGPDLELLIHPSDLVISGRETEAARARAILAERLTFTRAYLTWNKEANELEDQLRAIWRRLAASDGSLAAVLRDVEAVGQRLQSLRIPYEEWEVLFREQLLVERAACRRFHEGRLSGVAAEAASMVQLLGRIDRFAGDNRIAALIGAAPAIAMALWRHRPVSGEPPPRRVAATDPQVRPRAA